jgi:uncharacterized protein (TIGR00255 family)
MTGYGRGLAEEAGHRVAVELRSVNHRFLDLKLRGAVLDPAVEERLLGRIRTRVTRGAITLTVRVDSSGTTASFRVDLAVARRTYEKLRELADVLQLRRDISLSLVCAQPGVLVQTEPELDRGADALTEIATAAVDQALDQLVGMREAEGTALARDLAARLATLVSLVRAVQSHVSGAPEEAQRRLTERLGRLLKNTKVAVDEQRLAQEVAVLADRLDVTEELVRVQSHIEQLRTLMAEDADEAVGRRLDFLVQELGREFNTIASKSQLAEIARVVVDAKAELEKIREQVQNIE